MKSGTGGIKVLMGFEQDDAGAAEAQPARPGNVPVLPGETEMVQHELTHVPFQNCADLRTGQKQREPTP